MNVEPNRDGTLRVDFDRTTCQVLLFELSTAGAGPGSPYKDKNIETMRDLARRLCFVYRTGSIIIDLTRAQGDAIVEEFRDRLAANPRDPRDMMILCELALMVADALGKAKAAP